MAPEIGLELRSGTCGGRKIPFENIGFAGIALISNCGRTAQKQETAKYLPPPGRGSLLYFVPGTHIEWLSNTELPVVITEGEKKTIALPTGESRSESPQVPSC